MLPVALLALALFDPAGHPVTGATLRPAGPWLVILHPAWGPAVVPATAARAVLPSRSTLRPLPDCRRAARPGETWVGPEEGFRLWSPRHENEPPLGGEHDFHWFVSSGPHRLLVGAKTYLHPGLPEELSSATAVTVAGWRFGALSGLDFAGRAPDGTFWRWIGRNFDQQVGYTGVDAATRDEFDRILTRLCILP